MLTLQYSAYGITLRYIYERQIVRRNMKDITTIIIVNHKIVSLFICQHVNNTCKL